MSKVGSAVQRGGAIRKGGDTTRWRSLGMKQVVRSIRRRNRSQSGTESKIATARIVDRRTGSFSMFHIERVLVAHVLTEPSRFRHVPGPPDIA